MRRQALIKAVGAMAWPCALWAQPGEMRRVGVLMSVLRDDLAGITDFRGIPARLSRLWLVVCRAVMWSELRCSQRNWSV
jgi:hypothetical protein